MLLSGCHQILHAAALIPNPGSPLLVMILGGVGNAHTTQNHGMNTTTQIRSGTVENSSRLSALGNFLNRI
jgi:hypothetical protein